MAWFTFVSFFAATDGGEGGAGIGAVVGGVAVASGDTATGTGGDLFFFGLPIVTSM